MHLAQHHFQAQSRYFENTIHFALSAVFPEFYGFVALEMDQDAIWDGKVVLLGASGVMPDGLAFELGEGDEVPAALDVKGVVEPGAGSMIRGDLVATVTKGIRRRGECWEFVEVNGVETCVEYHWNVNRRTTRVRGRLTVMLIS